MLTFDEVLERLKDILSKELDEKRVFDKDVAKALGVDPAYFAVLKKRGRIPLDAVADFCAKRRISINWLLYDQSPKSLEEPTERFATVRYFRSIHASAGGGAQNDESEADRLALDEAVVRMLGGPGHLKHIDAIHVIGDSMEPLLSDGTTIFVDRSQKEITGGGIFVVQTPGGVFVKRVTLRPDGRVALLSENALYPAETLPPEEVTVIGRVVGKLESERV